MLLLCLLRVHWPPQEVVLLMNYAQDSLQMPVECVVSILNLFVIAVTTVESNHCQLQQHHSFILKFGTGLVCLGFFFSNLIFC